jgi:uncharacterized protein
MSIVRKVINNNKLYAWMIIVMLFIQAYAILVARQNADTKPTAQTPAAFAQELEQNRQLLQKALLKNPQIAINFGYLSLFILVIFLLGIIFLANFILKKAKGNEPIAKTLQNEAILWTWQDAVKIVIISLFLNYAFFAFEHLIKKILGTPAIDKRASMVLDTVLMDIIVFLFILYFVVVKYKQRITALGISLKNIMKNLWIALSGYIAFLPILAIIFSSVIFAAKALNYTPAPEPIYELVFKEQRPVLLTIISVMVVFFGPVIEEIFFRGFLYSALKKSLNMTKAMVISAFIFSLLHTNVLGFAPIMALGVFLAYLREKTGSLIPSIVVHIIHNTALTGVMFLIRKTLALA